MPAPTIIDYQETTWNGTGSPKSTPAITWLANDVIAVIAGCGSAVNPDVPTATGLTFGSQIINTGGGCGLRISAVVAGSGGTSAVTASVGVADDWGMGVWVFRGSAGLGNVWIVNSTELCPLTATGANGAIIWGSFDFSATIIGTFVPVASNIREQTDFGTTYTVQVADLADQPSIASVNYGTSGGTGSYTVGAFEIKAGAAAAVGVPIMWIKA